MGKAAWPPRVCWPGWWGGCSRADRAIWEAEGDRLQLLHTPVSSLSFISWKGTNLTVLSEAHGNQCSRSEWVRRSRPAV